MTSRALRMLSIGAVLLLAGGAPALADDDGDDGGGGGAGAGAGGAGGGGGGGGGGGPGSSGDGAGRSAADRGGLGPNPGRIPMPPSWQRALDNLFGATPAPAPAPAAPPRAELVAFGLPPAALASLRAQGFAVVADRAPAGLVRLRGPAGLTEAQALARLRAAAPGAVADRNHRYRLAGEAEPDPEPEVARPGCAAAAGLVALIDTGVDPRHPMLAGRIERQEVLRGPGRRPARTTHGTAVAARLAAAAPELRIAVFDAFHLGPDGEAADAFDLSAAVARAGEIGAAIATVSVVGPANAVLDRLGTAAASRGTVFVAAAGNDGPRAAPLYPAAYGWAVAVTAVDAAGRPWSRAAAGPHITFAAQGVEVPIAPAGQARPRRWSGTSFAAPVVSAALATLPGGGGTRIEALAALARDAGPPGRDPVYGWGVVETQPCRPVMLVSDSDTAADR